MANIKPDSPTNIDEIVRDFLKPVLDGAVTQREALRQSLLRAAEGDISILTAFTQSWDSGRATNLQVYSGSGALLFGNDYVLKPLSDPTDSSVGQIDTVSSDASVGGSIWPLLASRLEEAHPYQKLNLIPGAKGGSFVSQWQPGSDLYDRTTLFGSAMNRAREFTLLTGKPISAIHALLGQGDAAAGMTGAAYKAGAIAFADAAKSITGAKTILGKWPRPTDAATLAGAPAIWQAIGELWVERPDLFIGGYDLSTVVTDDSLHYTSDPKTSWHADQLYPIIKRLAGKPEALPFVPNLMPKSEQFDIWTHPQITATPNADGKAARLTTAVGTAVKNITSPAMSVEMSKNYIVGCRAKAETGRYIQIYGNNGNWGAFYANFDLLTGAVTAAVGAGVSAMIRAVDAGYFECQVLRAATASGTSAQINLAILSAGTDARGANGPDAVSILLKESQVNARISLGPYVATN